MDSLSVLLYCQKGEKVKMPNLTLTLLALITLPAAGLIALGPFAKYRLRHQMIPAKLTSEFHVGEVHTGDDQEAEAILHGPW